MSKYLLSLDPSLRATGCALWRDGILIAVHLIRTDGRPRGPELWQHIAQLVHAFADEGNFSWRSPLWIERPVHHRGGGRKADPETLLELCMLLGAIVASMPEWTPALVTKSQWAGTAPKEVVCARVQARLSPAEIQAIEDTYTGPAHLLHNVLDAVGVGLHAQGRMKT